METAIAVLAFIAFAAVWVLIRGLISAGVDKGANAVSNAVKRAQEKNDPPKAESLADRYRMP